ncbi:hypothetical protein SDC9_175963 [bioreactor metagenome]|uniref:Uncharacterized protein n=1 Tax=bioreactor metagenome TaxID=1076179 RepID=A0A645GNM1_9ZZZZ
MRIDGCTVASDECGETGERDNNVLLCEPLPDDFQGGALGIPHVHDLFLIRDQLALIGRC